MKNILAFGASNSTKSINKALATFTATQCKQKVTLIDLNDYEMPIFSMERKETNGIPQLALDFKELIKSSDGIIISFAEHNGSYSTAFKNILDWVSTIDSNRWNDKPMFLMATSPGARGGQNVLEHAKGYFPHMSAKVVASYSLPSFYDNFKEGEIVNEKLNEKFKNELNTFVNSL